MIKIDRHNFKTIPPEELAHGLNVGTYGIIETGIGALVEIVKYISGAIGERKLLRARVIALENAYKAQAKLLEQMAKEILELKSNA